MKLHLCFLHFILTIWIFLFLFTHTQEVPSRHFDTFGWLLKPPVSWACLRASHLELLALEASYLLGGAHCTNMDFSYAVSVAPQWIIYLPLDQSCACLFLLTPWFRLHDPTPSPDPATLTPMIQFGVSRHSSSFHDPSSGEYLYLILVTMLTSDNESPVPKGEGDSNMLELQGIFKKFSYLPCHPWMKQLLTIGTKQ